MASTNLKPNNERKADLYKNNSEESSETLQEVKERDRGLKKVPLRIDHRTIALVRPEKQTPEFASELRKRFNK